MKYRIGMIGSGSISRSHTYGFDRLNTYYDDVQVEKAVICSPHITEEKAKDMGWNEIAYDWKTVVTRDDIDVIDICAYDYLHYDIAKAAMENGKMVICEKPLADTYEQAVELAEIAESKNIRATVCTNYRYIHALRCIAHLVKSGAKVCEMFFNTSSEISPPFCSEIAKMAADAGIKIDSVHPFSSFIETGYFFSDYARRMEEGIDIYRRYFEGAAQIGARFFVFHGANLTLAMEPEKYAERLYLLSAAARKEGICLCQENVSRCLAGQIEYVKALKKILGDDISFTLDIKQANRAGQDPFEMAKVMGKNIKLVHINDYNEENDCLLPCRGDFNLKELKNTLDAIGYEGNYIIEVYRKNYTEYSDIEDSYTKLNKLFYS